MSDQPMTTAELAECAEVAGKATPGPWDLWTSCSWRRFGSEFTGATVCEPIRQNDGHPDIYFRNGGCNGPDAAFIARSREWVPRLLATVAARDAEIERLKKTRDMCREAIQDADLCTGCGRERGFEHYCRGGLGLYD